MIILTTHFYSTTQGWIYILTLTLSNFACIIDIYLYHDQLEERPETYHLFEKYNDVNNAQWSWLLFACTISFIIAIGFSLVELFRREEIHLENTKSTCESVFEGICLVLLVIIWVPTVAVSTSENGISSSVGNSYFFTWGCAVLVIQTCISWLQDWRKSVHAEILRQAREYKDSQLRNGGLHLTGNMDKMETVQVTFPLRSLADN